MAFIKPVSELPKMFVKNILEYTHMHTCANSWYPSQTKCIKISEVKIQNYAFSTRLEDSSVPPSSNNTGLGYDYHATRIPFLVTIQGTLTHSAYSKRFFFLGN